MLFRSLFFFWFLRLNFKKYFFMMLFGLLFFHSLNRCSFLFWYRLRFGLFSRFFFLRLFSSVVSMVSVLLVIFFHFMSVLIIIEIFLILRHRFPFLSNNGFEFFTSRCYRGIFFDNLIICLLIELKSEKSIHWFLRLLVVLLVIHQVFNCKI